MAVEWASRPMTNPVDDPSETLREGIRACRQGNWRGGYTLLSALAQQQEKRGNLPGFFYGYLGHAIARCEGRKHVGLELCRHAVQVQPFQPENYLNLAATYLLVGNRRLAVKAMREGLRIDSTHAGLVDLNRQLGIRRTPPVPFLSRDNPLNQLLGRLTYRLEQARVEQLKRRQEEAELDVVD
jgi:hypothetical protein